MRKPISVYSVASLREKAQESADMLADVSESDEINLFHDRAKHGGPWDMHAQAVNDLRNLKSAINYTLAE